MAHKKAGDSIRNGRNSKSKRLGVKLSSNWAVKVDNILARQRGTKFYADYGVGLGKGHTLFMKVDGVVRFETKGTFGRKCVSIVAV